MQTRKKWLPGVRRSTIGDGARRKRSISAFNERGRLNPVRRPRSWWRSKMRCGDEQEKHVFFLAVGRHCLRLMQIARKGRLLESPGGEKHLFELAIPNI